VTPVHDQAGNMTTMPKPTDPESAIEATYDAWNRLVEVTDGGVLVAKFEYDGTGRRIVKHSDSEAPGAPDGIDRYEHYFYSGMQVIEMRDTTTSTAEPENLDADYQYIWSPRYIDALILRDANLDADGQCDDQRLYYLNDANMNVTALFDAATGQIVERYIYDPYGHLTVLDADFTADADNVSDYDNSYLYTGRRLDTETGLYFYRARYYHAGLGTFVTRDPIRYRARDANLYRYVANSPMNVVDPNGLQRLGDIASPMPGTGVQYGDMLEAAEELAGVYDAFLQWWDPNAALRKQLAAPFPNVRWADEDFYNMRLVRPGNVVTMISSKMPGRDKAWAKMPKQYVGKVFPSVSSINDVIAKMEEHVGPKCNQISTLIIDGHGAQEGVDLGSDAFADFDMSDAQGKKISRLLRPDAVVILFGCQSGQTKVDLSTGRQNMANKLKRTVCTAPAKARTWGCFYAREKGTGRPVRMECTPAK
jgi:RHS repeat-associated protein